MNPPRNALSIEILSTANKTPKYHFFKNYSQTFVSLWAMSLGPNDPQSLPLSWSRRDSRIGLTCTCQLNWTVFIPIRQVAQLSEQHCQKASIFATIVNDILRSRYVAHTEYFRSFSLSNIWYFCGNLG